MLNCLLRLWLCQEQYQSKKKQATPHVHHFEIKIITYYGYVVDDNSSGRDCIVTPVDIAVLHSRVDYDIVITAIIARVD